MVGRFLALVLLLISSSAWATGLPSLGTSDRVIILLIAFLFIALIGLIPAALIYYKVRKRWIFLLSPVFGFVIYWIFE